MKDGCVSISDDLLEDIHLLMKDYLQLVNRGDVAIDVDDRNRLSRVAARMTMIRKMISLADAREKVK